jgi:hypothetical protein
LSKAADSWDRDAFEQQLRAVIKDWRAALTLSPEARRQMLQVLLTGPIYVTRRADGGWSFRGKGVLNKVLSGWFATVRVPAAELESLEAEAEQRLDPQSTEDHALA